MNTNERNLLMGMLAIQLDMVSRLELVAAFGQWVTDPTQALEELLEQRGVITNQQRQVLVSITDRYGLMLNDPAVASSIDLKQLSSLASEIQATNDSEATKAFTSIHTEQHQQHNSGTSHDAGPQTENPTGRFRFLRKHAQGGLGEVVVAEDTELHREVALKKILPRFSTNIDQRTRFVLEAEITGRLEHPGIVPVYSLGQTPDGQPFYAMRFIQGDSLKQAILEFHKECDKQSAFRFLSGIRRLLRRFLDVCNAVEYAHSRGVLHRDLKPSNIMLGKHGESLVVDWGLAKTIGKTTPHVDVDELTIVPSSGDSSHTRMGSVVGTLAFMSPEQADGRLDLLDPRTDVYSLGATLYSVLTGQDPVERDSEVNMLSCVRSGRIKPVREVQPLVPKSLAAICSKAMALQRNDRYSTAAELAEEIERWLADEPIDAYKDTLFERAGRWLRRHRTAASVMSVTVGLGLVSALSINFITASQNKALRIARDSERDQRIIAQNAEQLEANQREQLSQFASQLLMNAEHQLSDVPEAETFRSRQMEMAYESLKQVATTVKASNELRRSYAIACRHAGMQAARTLKAALGEERLKESLDIQQILMSEDPSVSNDDYLCQTWRDLATIQRAQGKLRDAFASNQKSLAIAQRLESVDAASTDYRRSAATARSTHAALLLDLGRSSEALDPARSAFETIRDLSRSPKAARTDDNSLILTGTLLLRVWKDLGQLDQAQQHYSEMQKLIEPLKSKHADHRSERFAIARLLILGSELEMDLNQVTAATHERLKEGYEILVSLRKFKNRTYTLYEADYERVQGRMLLLENKPNEALTLLNSAYTKIDSQIKQYLASGGTTDVFQAMTNVLTDQLACRQAMQDEAASARVRQQAADLLNTVKQTTPENVSLVNQLQRLSTGQLHQ